MGSTALGQFPSLSHISNWEVFIDRTAGRSLCLNRKVCIPVYRCGSSNETEAAAAKGKTQGDVLVPKFHLSSAGVSDPTERGQAAAPRKGQQQWWCRKPQAFWKSCVHIACHLFKKLKMVTAWEAVGLTAFPAMVQARLCVEGSDPSATVPQQCLACKGTMLRAGMQLDALAYCLGFGFTVESKQRQAGRKPLENS